MPDSWHLGFLPNRLLSGVALCLSILLIGCTRARVGWTSPSARPWTSAFVRSWTRQ